MSSPRAARRVAWSVPVVTVGVVVAAALAPAAAAAGPHPKLPQRTAAQLLADLTATTVQSLSGTVVETARLGLPSLPGADRTASLDWQSLVTGTHTAQVWFDGADRQRLALLGQLAESDVVHNGRDLWTYSSADGSVSHQVADPAASPTSVAEAAVTKHDVLGHTPLGAAQAALSAIDPTTAVSVDRTARVAGQPAYTLVLSPRDAHSTVRKVLIALDAVHRIPLRVQIFGSGKAPVFEVAFATLSYHRPSASVFAFRVPAGARVTDTPLGALTGGGKATKEVAPRLSGAPGAVTPTTSTTPKVGGKPTVIGTGWTSVVELPAGSSPFASTSPAGRYGSVGDLLGQMTTVLPGGDRLLHTALVNAVITTDGRTFLGAVDAGTLERVAASHVG